MENHVVHFFEGVPLSHLLLKLMTFASVRKFELTRPKHYFAFLSVERKPCEVDEFTCKNGRCIEIFMYCDTFDDCNDSSDEINCTTCDTDQQFFCPTTNTCLSGSKRCDGVVDCDGSYDEINCGKDGQRICESFEFECTKKFECIHRVLPVQLRE